MIDRHLQLSHEVSFLVLSSFNLVVHLFADGLGLAQIEEVEALYVHVVVQRALLVMVSGGDGDGVNGDGVNVIGVVVLMVEEVEALYVHVVIQRVLLVMVVAMVMVLMVMVLM